jgi:hypothetical protein
LDEAFVNYSDKTATIVYNTSDMLLQKSFELPINISQAGSTVLYSFSTSQGDVAFGAEFISADKQRPPETIVATHRVPSDVENITGRFKAGREGTLVIKFDNSFSWFTPKHLTYSIELNQPTGAIADNHRCVRSRNLLNALVNEQPALEKDLVDSIHASYNARVELLELETRLRQLQVEVADKRKGLEESLQRVLLTENRMEASRERKLGLCIRYCTTRAVQRCGNYCVDLLQRPSCLNSQLLTHVLTYLLSDAEAARAVAAVCKHWLALCSKQAAFTRLLTSKFQVVFVLGGR